MVKKPKNIEIGIVSIIFGLLGLILYFIGWFFYSFVDNRLYGIVIGFIFGIISIILGDLAKRKGDKYGSYGMILGGLIIIIGIITLLLTTPTTVVVGH